MPISYYADKMVKFHRTRTNGLCMDKDEDFQKENDTVRNVDLHAITKLFIYNFLDAFSEMHHRFIQPGNPIAKDLEIKALAISKTLISITDYPYHNRTVQQ